MNTLLAIRLMAQHYPTGLDGLAIITGKSPDVLRKEIAGNQANKLGLVDAGLISDACISVGSPHCYAYVNAVAANCGGVILIEGGAQAAVSGNILEALSVLVKEASDVLTVGVERAADGHISDNDSKAINQQMAELVEAFYSLKKSIDTAHKAGARK